MVGSTSLTFSGRTSDGSAQRHASLRPASPRHASHRDAARRTASHLAATRRNATPRNAPRRTAPPRPATQRIASLMSPVAFKWVADAMVPLRPEAAKAYEPGRVYWLEEVSERSWVSHSHQFAWLAEAWLQLPEDLAPLYPSPEHLRKRALIQAGFYDETAIPITDIKTAKTLIRYLHANDEFASVFLRDSTVFVRRAKSQRVHGPGAMSKAEFERSKNAILNVVAEMIGVSPEDLKAAAK